MARRVLVTGATGFVGSHLTEALDAQRYSVLAMTRHPDTYTGAGKPIFGDVYEPASLSLALAEADAAYYLVHSLSRPDFAEKDAEAALAFGRAAAEAGLERLIYLGGLGRDDADLSAHLKSRREVEHLLASGGVPVTVLRAGHRYRTRQHFLGDHTAARRPSSSDGGAEVGDDPHTTDCLVRRHSLSHRGP